MEGMDMSNTGGESSDD